MTRRLRRRAVLSGMAVLACLCSGIPLAGAAGGAPRFTAPSGPMKLTRVLERELGDGNSVVVTRSWRIRFLEVPAGYRVEGEQIAVEVDAPPRLAGLAEVERRNPQAGLFPIALDRAGMIVGGEPAYIPPIPGLTAAAEEYLEGAPADTRAEAMRYTMALQMAGARMTSRWPQDVFFPASGPRSDERAVGLPSGAEGTIAVSFNGRLDPSGARLAWAERRIVTHLGDSTRTSLEMWRMEPLD